ncbi:MAG: hypothetical protein ACJ76Y_22535 [Thermoanaerobaculia bacterium]
MNAKTAWLKPPFKAGGIDHLGIQQTPIRIFSTLLPGLTVVTDRVSNYSFYPWVAWAFDQEQDWGGLDFIRMLRRAECLLTLVAERHAHVCGEDVMLHSRGLVGRNTLVPALREDAPRPIPLGELAAPRSQNADSYFQHEAGGLGQYYLGPLRELGILQRLGARFEYSDDVGVPLAKAFDRRIDRKAFLRVVKHGLVDEKDLDQLERFCPCYLADHPPERELLIDLLFVRRGEPAQPDIYRRQTLLLLLDLASRRAHLGSAPLDAAFRAACLTGAIDDGTAWRTPKPWRAAQRAWATYTRNDWLSIGVLGIFWAALKLLDEVGGQAESTRIIGELVSREVKAALGKEAEQGLPDVIAAKAVSLPPLAQWEAPDHELQRSFAVRNEARKGNIDECLRAAIDTLTALAARHLEPQPYREIGIPPDYLDDYPLNLSSFHLNLAEDWRAFSLAEWAGVLATDWGLEAHLRVALRKMHYESRDTFLLYVAEEGVRRRPETDAPLPSFTASRLNRAVQFLADLGLVTWERPSGTGEVIAQYSEEWIARISPMGRQLREELGD